MNSRELADLFGSEMESLLNEYMESTSGTTVTEIINLMKLSNEQSEHVEDLLRNVITDVMYTTLLGLDGEASIGGTQQIYRLFDEEGNDINKNMDLSVEAYRVFHGDES